MTRIGLITITYNSDAYLETFVACLNQSVSDHELFLIVVDNASKVSPESVFNSCKLKTRLVSNEVNVGVAKANNQGSKIAIENGCEYLIFLNNDIEFGPAVVHDVVTKAIQYDAIVSPRIVTDDSNKTIWFENGVFNTLKGWTGEHCEATSVGDIQQVSYMPTCFSCMSVEIFIKVGAFDPIYFVYFDDTDFMYRALKSGVAMLVLLNVELVHRVGGTTGGVHSPFTAYQTSKNRLLFIMKHKNKLYAAFFTLIFVIYYMSNAALFRRDIIWFKNAIKGTRDAWRG